MARSLLTLVRWPSRTLYISYLQPCARSYSPVRPGSLAKRRHHLAGEQLDLPHDVGVRDAGKEGPADQVGHPVLLDEPTDLAPALVGTADDEAVGHELVQIGRDAGVDERVTPAARVLLAVGDHDVLLGQLPRPPLRGRDGGGPRA